MKSTQGMSVDHVFLAVSRGGLEVEPLVEAGFTEGPPNVHYGQGTACRRFFFDNAYLEFVWLENRAEASSSVVSRTGLGARLGEGFGLSRIGICVRLSPDLSDPPVSTWAYRPPYLPSGLAIPMAANSTNLEEPLLFFLPTGIARALTTPPHQNGARAISRIRVALPAMSKPSPELDWLVGSGLAAFDSAPAESLRVEFDGGPQDRSLTLDTPTPLVVNW